MLFLNQTCSRSCNLLIGQAWVGDTFSLPQNKAKARGLRVGIRGSPEEIIGYYYPKTEE
jgi:hypothetical protein